VYGSGGRLREEELVATAARLGLDADRVRAELRDGTHAARVDRDLESGRRSGVTATPGFFVNGVAHDGAFDAGSLIAGLTAGLREDSGLR
jgi:protein-disulfide isomerase